MYVAIVTDIVYMHIAIVTLYTLQEQTTVHAHTSCIITLLHT